MITSSDSLNTYDLGKYYTILPKTHNWNLKEFIKKNKAIKVNEGFSYSSGLNTQWESVDSLRKLIKSHVDKKFKI